MLRLARASWRLRRSKLFDAAWYRGQSPGRPIRAPTLHYLRRGAVEGWQPGPCFDGTAYLAAHADVDFSGANPLLHYLTTGQMEGRLIFPVGPLPRRQLLPLRSIPPTAPAPKARSTEADAGQLVSIIIPTRDRAGLLARCVEGLLLHTTHRAIEIIIVDNDSRSRRARRLLRRLARDPRIRVLAHPGPFNWSAMNNRAAREARGTFLLLLNNDIAVREPDWLGAMLAQAAGPGVGAVGARLLYPNGRIQHAGISLGRRALASHVFRHARADDPGPFGMLARTRDVAAVTGACLMVRRTLFAAVGGLEATHLRLTNSDIDLCLRLRARGKRIIWAHDAVLTHLEAASRGLDASPAQIARVRTERAYLLATWGVLAETDPTLPPGCVVAGERLLRPPPQCSAPMQCTDAVLDQPDVAKQLAPATSILADHDRTQCADFLR